MNPLESYILEQKENQRSILTFFNDLFLNKYELTGDIKWKVPTYFGKTWVFYMTLDKKQGIHLCFMRGRELTNDSGVLESKGRKMVLSYHVKNLEEIPYNALIEIIEEAIELDKKVPFKVRKK